MNILQKIGAAISGFFSKELPVVENAFTSAEKIVNVLKTFLGSATGQTIEAIIEALAPGVSTVVFAALNTFFTDFGLVSAELSKSPAEITADGLKAAANLTDDSKTLVLSNISSIIGHAVSTAGNGGSTLQQAIVSLPIVHNPDALGSVPVTNTSNAPAATIAPNL